MEMEECILCPRVTEGCRGNDTCQVGKKGLTALIHASRVKTDELKEKFEKVMTNMETDSKVKLTVHKKCRQYYTEPNRIASSKKRHRDSILSPQPSPVKRRSCDFNFDIRHDCFYCGSSKGNQKERQYSLTAVRTEEYLDRLKERISRRNDSLSWQVLARVSNYNDLVAAEAKYHRSCMSMFYSGRDPVKKPSQAGRPPDEKRIELFDKLCSHIEDIDECKCSLNELVNIMNSFNNDEELYFSENWLQEKLVRISLL